MFKKQRNIFFRAVCLFMLTALILSATGCRKTDKTGAGENGIVKLKMILVGEKPAIYDEIYGKLNEMLRKDIGAEVEINYFNFSDVSQKYSLLFSSNEKFDIVFSAKWLQYNQQASKNGFLEITDDMLKKYAPNTYKYIPENAKNEAKVNGKMYMIPNTALEFGTGVVLIRGDLREKYGIGEIKNISDMEKYLYAVAQNDKNIIPLCDVAKSMELLTENSKGLVRITPSGVAGVKYEYPTDKMIISTNTDIYKDRVYKIREYVDAGIIPADIIANKTTTNMFENGKAATYFNNLETSSTLAKKLRKAHPEWKVELYDLSGDCPKIANSYISNGLSISRTSKNAEKALQFIDLLRYDKRYFDLTWYGIEGKHWEAVGDDSYRSLNDTLPEDERYSAGNVWGWKTQELLRKDVDDIPEKSEIMDRWVKNTVDVPINGFNFSDAAVKTEIASVSNVDSQYGAPLENGLIAKNQIEASIETYRTKLKQAHIDKLYDEVNSQYNKYIKNIK